MVGIMVSKEDFSTEQFEWIKKQLELRRQLHPFMSVQVYNGIDKWLVDDEHVCAFVSEYLGLVIDEMRDNLSKENFEKVKLCIKNSDALSDIC